MMPGILLDNSFDAEDFTTQLGGDAKLLIEDPSNIIVDEESVDFLNNQISDLNALLHRFFPYGHPDFVDLVLKELDLHSRKNHDYAHGGDPLGNFKRVAKILALYPNLDLSHPATVGIIYLMKQLDATLWMLSGGHEAKVEGHAERWRDISIYSKIISILIEEKERKKI